MPEYTKLGIYDGIKGQEELVQTFKICKILIKGWTDTVALAYFPVILKAKALRVWTAGSAKDTIAAAYITIIDGCKPPNE